MTPETFDLLALLLKSREPIISGARLVILRGMKNAEAARQVGATPQSVHRSVQRFWTLHNKISAVFGPPQSLD